MIAIHQSQFLPWSPYIYKMLKSDVFLVLDDVQFQKNGVQNRNKIKTPQGAHWLTVPVKARLGTPINRVEVVRPQDIYPKLLKTLELNYRRSQFFDEIYKPMGKIFARALDKLHRLNRELLEMVARFLDHPLNIRLSSDVKTKGTKDDLVIELIRHFHQTEYLSGKGALGYMDLEKFKRAGIKVYTYTFSHLPYPQVWMERNGFIPELSIIDLLFNNRDNALSYILSNGSMEQIV